MFLRGVRDRTGLLVAVMCGWLCSSAARAEPRDEDLFIRPEDQRVVLFGGVDAGRSVFVSGGAKQSLIGSLDRSGFVFMESSGFGLTRERFRPEGADVPVLRFTHQTSALTGYQWNGDRIYVSALAGPEIQEQQLAYGGRVYRFSQPRLGGRGQLDLWTNPTQDTLVTGTLIASSTRGSVWGRASTGFRVFEQAFLGPEVTFYVTPTYSEVRYGMPHRARGLDREPSGLRRLDGG